MDLERQRHMLTALSATGNASAAAEQGLTTQWRQDDERGTAPARHPSQARRQLAPQAKLAIGLTTAIAPMTTRVSLKRIAFNALGNFSSPRGLYKHGHAKRHQSEHQE